MEEHQLINLEYSGVKVLLPNIEYFIEKIKNDELIRFLRVNHGFIDGIHHAYPIYSNFEKDFRNKNYDRIADSIIKAYLDKQWGLKYFHNISDDLKLYISNLIRLLREYDDVNNKIDIAISLGVGLNQFWGIHEKNHPLQKSRTEFSHVLDKVVNKKFFYSGIVKHYTITDEIYKLFELIESKNYNVVFLGPDYFGKHKDTFEIKNWNFIEIPKRKALDNLDEYIDRISDINNSSDNKTIVFLQCGHIMSANIIERLIDTDISFFDIGRGFDIKIKEEFVGGNLATVCWTFLDEGHLKNYVKNLRNR